MEIKARIPGMITAINVKVGDEVELLGLGEDKKSVVTGVEMFRKILDEGEGHEDGAADRLSR